MTDFSWIREGQLVECEFAVVDKKLITPRWNVYAEMDLATPSCYEYARGIITRISVQHGHYTVHFPTVLGGIDYIWLMPNTPEEQALYAYPGYLRPVNQESAA